MTSTLCILALLAVCATVYSQVNVVNVQCTECNECPGSNHCASLQRRCALRFAAPSCITIRAVDTPDLVVDGCAIIESTLVLNSITGSTATDCIMIGDDVFVRGQIDLLGGNDYLVMGNNVRTRGIVAGPGRDCVKSGANLRTDGVDLGPDDDEFVSEYMTTEIDGSGLRGDVDGGEGDDCIVIGTRTAKRSISEVESIFASFDEGPSKRSTAVGSSFLANVNGETGNDCLKLYCTEFDIASGGDGPDCIDVQAARFHRVNGGAGNDAIRAEKIEALNTLFVPGGIYGEDGNDGIQISESRTNPFTISDGSFGMFPGQVNSCCAQGPRVVSRRCEQRLFYPCVIFP